MTGIRGVWITALVSILMSAEALLMPAEAFAQSKVITLESQVKGNQEQPNVLSIVPWKEASDRRRIESSIEADIGRLFQHLDKDEFARQQHFHKAFLATQNQNEQTNLQTHH